MLLCLFLSLFVVRKEVGKALGGVLEDLDAGQVDDAEVVGLAPVEAAAVDEEELLVAQEVEREPLVVCDVEFFRIQSGEDVKRSLGLDRADAGTIVKGFMYWLFCFL